MPDLAAGLEAVAGALLDQGLPLEALPVVCLWEHVGRHVTRQLAATVAARCARARALCALGLLGDAARVLWGLMAGADLPEEGSPFARVLLPPPPAHGGGGAAAHTASGKGGGGAHGKGGAAAAQPDAAAALMAKGPFAYDAAAWPGAACNKRARDAIATAPLAPAVAAAYGPWLCAAVDRARAAWLLAAGGERNAWRAPDAATGPKASALPPAGGKEAAAAAPDKGHHPQQQPAAAADASPEAPRTCEPCEGALLDAAAALLRASTDKALLALAACAAAAPAAGTGAADGAPRSAGASRPGSARPGSRGGGGAELPPLATALSGASTLGAGSPLGVGKEALPPLMGRPASRPPSARSFAAGSGGARPAAEPPGADAVAHAHAAVHGLLLLSEVEAARWLPSRALEAALAAAAALRVHGARAAAALAAGGDAGRHALGPHDWLRARVQVVACLQAARHHEAVLTEAAAALAECAALREPLLPVALLWLRAGAVAALGDAPAALAGARDAAAAAARLGVADERAWRAHLDAAALAARCGRAAEAGEEARCAMELLRARAHESGLAEMAVSARALGRAPVWTPAPPVSCAHTWAWATPLACAPHFPCGASPPGAPRDACREPRLHHRLCARAARGRTRR